MVLSVTSTNSKVQERTSTQVQPSRMVHIRPLMMLQNISAIDPEISKVCTRWRRLHELAHPRAHDAAQQCCWTSQGFPSTYCYSWNFAPTTSAAKAKQSETSEITISVGLPAPWPARVSILHITHCCRRLQCSQNNLASGGNCLSSRRHEAHAGGRQHLWMLQVELAC